MRVLLTNDDGVRSAGIRRSGRPSPGVHLGGHRRTRRGMQRVRAQVHVRPARPSSSGWRAARTRCTSATAPPPTASGPGCSAGSPPGRTSWSAASTTGPTWPTTWSTRARSAPPWRRRCSARPRCACPSRPANRPPFGRPAERLGPGVPGYDFGLAAWHGAGLAAAFLRTRREETVRAQRQLPGQPGPGRGAGRPGRGAAGPGSVSTPAAVLTRPGQRVYPRAPVKDWDSDPGPQSLYLFGRAGRGHPEADGPADTDVAALRHGPHLGDPAVRGDRAGRVLARDDLVPGPAPGQRAMAGTSSLDGRAPGLACAAWRASV